MLVELTKVGESRNMRTSELWSGVLSRTFKMTMFDAWTQSYNVGILYL